MSTMRAGWETPPNKDIRILHVEDQMFDYYEFSFTNNEKCTSKEIELVESLLAIRGVKKISVSKFEVRVEKGSVFDWEEIAPKVERIVMEWCGHCEIIKVPDDKLPNWSDYQPEYMRW